MELASFFFFWCSNVGLLGQFLETLRLYLTPEGNAFTHGPYGRVGLAPGAFPHYRF